MKEKQKKQSKRKMLIVIVMLVFVFSLIKVGISLAQTESFTITSAEILDKSSTAQVNDFSFEDCKVTSEIVFHNIGDSVTYSIKIKNNSKTNYTIKSIYDDNEIEYIKYEYNNYEGTKLESNQEFNFIFTEKYEKEITDVNSREQNISVNIKFVLEDEEENIIEEVVPVDTNNEPEIGEKTADKTIGKIADKITDKSVSPKTGDDVEIYITTSIVSLIVLLILIKKNSGVVIVSHKSKKGNHRRRNKFFSIILICVITMPAMSKAATGESLTVTINNKIAFKDKLILTYSVDGEEEQMIIPYEENAEDLVSPEKEGYSFDGWKKEDGTPFDETEPITDDIKIVATFKPVAYTISCDLKGGMVSEGNPTSYTIESDDITLNKPQKEKYKFIGWSGTGITGMVDDVTILKGSTGDKSYTANWEQLKYKVTFDAKGGTVNPESVEINIGDEIGTLPTPSNSSDYVFRGWYEDKEYKRKVTANTKPEKDTTYYAKWVDRMETIYSLEGPVTFNNGGNITGDEVPELQNQAYINTGIKLFDENNFGKDFEIGFEIVDVNISARAQQTFINSKLEDGSKNYPGFAFRRYNATDKLEVTSRSGNNKKDGDTISWEYDTVHKVVLYRINNVLYVSIDGGEKIEYHSYDNITYRFDTPVTFGASLDKNGNPMRYLDGTIKNIYIILENKPEE